MLLIFFSFFVQQICFNSRITFNKNRFDEIFDKILRVRIPGTQGHEYVKNFITGWYIELNWTVKHDAFLSSTPFHHQLLFTNIMATRNPTAPNHLALACHYDSKYYPPNHNRVFMGGIDSAVSCAMMLYLAETLTPYLSTHSDTTLQMIFFDGEEAFKEWTSQDSLYGARHLANLFSKTPQTHGGSTTIIESMKLLVLLDLIGYENPTFGSLYPQTEPEFEQLCDIERRLYPNSKNRIFQSPSRDGIDYHGNQIEDDHIPFVELGVKVVHLIVYPFPKIWHRLDDDGTNIEMDSVKKITMILAEFFKTNLLTY